MTKSLFKRLETLLSKRQKIITTSILVAFGFILTTQTMVIVFHKYYFILLFVIFTYLVSLWAIWPGINKTKAVILLILPIFYCISVPGFYFLFPYIRWLTRLPMAIFFGLSFYCLLLAQNVLNVSSDRAIPLYRAASTANFIYTIFTSILIYTVIFSFNLPFYWNGVLVFSVSFPLMLQALWSIKMERIDSQTLVYSAILSFILGEMAIAFSFWQAPPLVISLFINWINYAILGVLTEFTKDRLNKRVVLEYVLGGSILFLLTYILTSIHN